MVGAQVMQPVFWWTFSFWWTLPLKVHHQGPPPLSPFRTRGYGEMVDLVDLKQHPHARTRTHARAPARARVAVGPRSTTSTRFHKYLPSKELSVVDLCFR